MNQTAPSDEQLLERLEQRFPSEEDSRIELAAAVEASAMALGEFFGAFCLRAGVPKERVAAIFRALSDATMQRELKIELDSPHLWRQVSDCVTKWWRDPAYLDESGAPRDLQEYGPQPSIEALLEGTVEVEQRAEAKDLLRKSVASDSGGVWHFEEQHGALRVAGEPAVERLLTNISGMLTTFLDNQVRRRDPLVAKNFDRTALVQTFPVSLLPELRMRLIRRYQRVLEELDEWMMERSKQDTSGPVTVVGVTMFMHASNPRSST